jgi:hypothetical protein
MKQARIFSTIAIVATLLIASCGKEKGSSAVMIPKQALMVVQINSSSLTNKLSWEEIKSTNWFRTVSANTSDSLSQQILSNPDNSGIDTKSDLVFFMSKQGRGGIAVFEGSVKDAGKFEQFNQQMLKKDGKESATEKDGDIRFLQTDEGSLIGWNDSKFMYINDAPINPPTNEGFESDESYGNTSFGKDSLKKFVKNLFNISGSDNLANDDRYEDMLKESGDIFMWTNMDENPAFGSNPAMDMMAMQKLYKGTYSASTINFEDGKISWKTKTYLSKELAKIFEQHDSKNVSTELINRIPSQNVIAAMVMNYPPEGLHQFIKAAGLDGVANAYLGKFNYSLAEMMKAYKGDALLTVSDISLKQVQKTMEGTDETYPSQEPSANVLLAFSVNDKASFDKMVSLAETNIKGENGKLPKDLTYKTSNEWFVASNSTQQVDQFLAGGNNKVSFASKISGHPFGMYIDIQKALSSGKAMMPGFSSGFDLSMKTWQDVVITGGEYKDGYCVSLMEINMMDKKTNSLKQMNNFLNQLAAERTQTDRVYGDEVIPPSAD